MCHLRSDLIWLVSQVHPQRLLPATKAVLKSPTVALSHCEVMEGLREIVLEVARVGVDELAEDFDCLQVPRESLGIFAKSGQIIRYVHYACRIIRSRLGTKLGEFFINWQCLL